MKKLAVLLSLAATLATGNALALDTATIDVSATVLGTCTFAAGPYAMAFGNIDPLTAANTDATATLSFTCTNGSNWALQNLTGAYTMAGSVAGNTLDYAVLAHTTAGTGTGLAQTVALTGRVTPAQAQAAAADTYTGTLTIDLWPTP